MSHLGRQEVCGSADAVRLALAYLGSNRTVSPLDFGADEKHRVHDVARRLRGPVIHALHRLGDSPRKLAETVPITAGFDGDGPAGHGGQGVFGPRGAGHGLSVHSHFFSGYRALEPHYTKTLARLLSPAHAGPAAFERARTFIGALYDAAGRPLPNALDLSAVGPGLTCESEVVLPRWQGKRRVDVLLRWRDRAGLPHCLVLEAKFGAVVGKGTLSAYGAFASRAAGARERTHLFLAVIRPDPAASRATSWHQVLWFSVLRHWERRLAACGAATDDEFQLFRAALWQQAAGHR